VGSGLRSPDNLAIDANGNIYIIEDRNGRPRRHLVRAGHQQGRRPARRRSRSWPLGLVNSGRRATGLYFDKFDPNVAYVNIQHPSERQRHAAPDHRRSGTRDLRHVPRRPRPAGPIDYMAQGLIARPGFNGVAMTTDKWTYDAQGNPVADNRLFVADFANGRVMSFDNQWNDITASTPFARPADLHAGWMPFNVQQLGDGRIYVAWTENAFEIDEPTEEIPGGGRIVAYDRDGQMLQDYTDHDKMNNPWGMVIAPDSFGAMAGALLVANFGDGTIAAYDVDTGADLGYLKDPDGNVIAIDGIWGLTFGNGVHLGQADQLYFTAGPDEERDGIFGKLAVAAVPEPESYAMFLAGLGLIGVMLRRRTGC
jgi:hypothetical protein